MKTGLAKVIIIFVVGLVIGWLVGSLTPLKLVAISRLAGGTDKNKNIPGTVVNNLRGQVSSVDGQAIKFRIMGLNGSILADKVAQIDSGTALYLLSPKTDVDFFGEDYLAKSTDIKNRLSQATLTKNTAAIGALRAELTALSVARSAARNQQAGELSAKINSLPADSSERREAERAYWELTSAFKYSIITPADIKTGDLIQVWSNDDLSNKDKFVATRIEIKR